MISLSSLIKSILAIAMVVSCSGEKVPVSSYTNNHYFTDQPDNSMETVKSSQPKTIYYELEAGVFPWEIAPGKVVEAWGYNNQVPGPALKAMKGDTLVIRLKNNLTEKTTIHWHGLRIPSAMDGTEEVQRAVMPGETFEYRFVVPDAGTFWYHPHSNETVQMERGMYGALVVEDTEEPILDAERIFMIDDMKLNRAEEFTQPGWFYPRWMERHDGREGETLLVNGKEVPEIELAAGRQERWSFINAASARYFVLNLEGRMFRLIGTDGGLIEKPRFMDSILVSPGERVEIIAGPFREGEQFSIQSLPYDGGTGRSKKEVFANVRTGKPQPSSVYIPETLRTIEPIAGPGASANRHIKLHGKRNWKTGVDFTINDQMHLNDTPVRVGELQVWEITNPSMLDHPFHLHGFFFQVIEVNGKPVDFLSWKDTFNVPRDGSIKIAWMPDDRKGKWMYHCHILEHHAAGMMAHFEVVDKDAEITRGGGQYPHNCH